MTKFIRTSLICIGLLSSTMLSQATLVNFTDYGLGGTTASWDIYAGDNYLQEFTYSTGDSGNSISGYTGNLDLKATVNSWQAGPPNPANTQATGPIGSDGSGGIGGGGGSIPGDREFFYTFYGSPPGTPMGYSITGTLASDADTIVFQFQNATGSNGGLSNMTFNSISAAGSTNTGTLVTTWEWTGLNLSMGDTFTFAWQSLADHSVFDAFQIQMGTIPEPNSAALVGISLLFATLYKKSRYSKTS